MSSEGDNSLKIRLHSIVQDSTIFLSDVIRTFRQSRCRKHNDDDDRTFSSVDDHYGGNRKSLSIGSLEDDEIKWPVVANERCGLVSLKIHHKSVLYDCLVLWSINEYVKN